MQHSENAQAVATVEGDAPSRVVQTDASSLMEVISRAANDPHTDVDKLERLMGLYERICDRQSEQAFNEAMAAAQQEMPQVLRDANNDQTHSKYARLETVAKAINPVIAKHGFAMSFGTDKSHLEDHYRVTCRVSHADGFSRDYHADVPSDMKGLKGNPNKTVTHGFGSTMSYGRRYLTMLIFNIATTDDDGNGASGSLSEDQARELMGLVAETKTDLPKFLTYMRADSVQNIPANSFNRAKTALEAKRKNGGGK